MYEYLIKAKSERILIQYICTRIMEYANIGKTERPNEEDELK